MRNIININSANIKTFGFTTKFDLLAKTLLLDISALTEYNGSGASAVVGVAFDITDPSGLKLATIDFTAPAINPPGQSTFSVNLVGGFALFGWYTIIGVMRDADNKDYTIKLTKEIRQPEGFVKNGYVPSTFDFDVNCNLPMVTITELTKFIYCGTRPDTITKTGILSYPRGTLNDLNFNFTPISIGGSGNVYTGRYTVNCDSVALYDLQDGVYLGITYRISNFEKVVSCISSFTEIVCCISDLTDEYNRDPFSTNGKAIKAKLDRANLPFFVAVFKEKSGQDASEQVAEISRILGCDCDCGSNAIEPQAIIAGGSQINNLSFLGLNAANVTSASSGSTTQISINVKNVIVTNASDDASFTINKIISGSAIEYAITINVPILASSILQAIQDDDELTIILKNILGSSGAGLSLDGLNGGCVITLANCNYSLIEANNIPKTVNSIKIGSTIYNAPGGLLLSNTMAVATWLNGLGKGTFSAAVDSGSSTVIISSNANPNVITDFLFTTSAGVTKRIFSRACIGLVDFLNAVITYICDLDGNQVAFGLNGKKLFSYNSAGAIIQTDIDPAAHLSDVIAKIMASQGALYDKLASLGLTCSNVKSLFTTQTNALIDTDGIFGTKGDACAKISFDELAGIILNKISGNSAWQSALCTLSVNCSGAPCPPVTNVSATCASGTLTVNCNDAGSSSAVQIRYRINNSGGTYTIVDTTSSLLPLAITGVANAQYEVGIRKQCSSNAQWSAWTTNVSNNPCVAPTSFGVSISGSDFVAAVTLTSPQTKVEITMINPTGGKTVTTSDLGGQTGSVNIPVPTGIYGTYTFSARAICSTSPFVASASTDPATVSYDNPSADNIRLAANYSLTFTDCRNGTASGIPTSFNSRSVSGIFNDHTDSLSSGTITGTVTGSLPGSLPVYVRLVKNGLSIIDSNHLTGSSPFTFNLTNTALIAYPDTISIEIDS